jgi:hypothetical protein
MAERVKIQIPEYLAEGMHLGRTECIGIALRRENQKPTNVFCASENIKTVNGCRTFKDDTVPNGCPFRNKGIKDTFSLELIARNHKVLVKG